MVIGCLQRRIRKRNRIRLSSKKCRSCGSSALRRVNRTGYLQRAILARLGYFPWECAICRNKSFFKDDGHGNAARRKKTD
jgi:hypothetical protein